MYNYITIGFGILIAGLLIFAIIKGIISKPKSTSNSVTIEDNRSELDKISTRIDKSATEIAQNFFLAIYHKESPFTRPQRRMILRHYKKFLWAWPDLTGKQQDVDKIINFLVSERCNSNVVNKYKFINSNLAKVVDNSSIND